MKFADFLNESKGNNKIRALINKSLNFKEAMLSYVDTGSLKDYIDEMKDRIKVAKDIEKEINSGDLTKEDKRKIRVSIRQTLNFKEALLSFVDTESMQDYIDEMEDRIETAKKIEKEIHSSLNESALNKDSYDSSGYIKLKDLEDAIETENASIEIKGKDVTIKSLDDAITKFKKYAKDLNPMYMPENDGKITVSGKRIAKVNKEGNVLAIKANGSKYLK